jgi:hypothetical protein
MSDKEHVLSSYCDEHKLHADRLVKLEGAVSEFVRDSRAEFKELRKSQVEIKSQLAKWSGIVIGIASIPTIIKVAEMLVPAAAAAVEVGP